MRIGVDARIDRTGIGRYTFRLLSELADLDRENTYVAFLRREAFSDPDILDARLERCLADIPWYSVEEQLRLGSVIRSADVDLMHFTHFNVPLLYRGPYVVTIHDLTHELRGRLEAPGDPAARRVRALGYSLVLRRATERARRVIAVSGATKRAIVERLGIDPERISVTYEGVDPGLLESSVSADRLAPDGPYVLYVGGGHPHKNLPRLVQALAACRDQASTDVKLVLAGDLGRYEEQVRAAVRAAGLTEAVFLLGRVSDAQLAALYRGATALALVSLSEGFGLPGLEAMAVGTPVLASRIEALTEVYGQAAEFVDPTDVADIGRGMLRLLGDTVARAELVGAGRSRAARYSWRSMAEETVAVYRDALTAPSST